MVEYVSQLQEGILEAYVGVVQGLKAGGKGKSVNARYVVVSVVVCNDIYPRSNVLYYLAYLLLPQTQNIFGFLAVVYSGTEKSDSIMRSLIGLLGYVSSVILKVFLIMHCFTVVHCVHTTT
jgi:importin subunit beta-1